MIPFPDLALNNLPTHREHSNEESTFDGMCGGSSAHTGKRHNQKRLKVSNLLRKRFRYNGK